MFAVIGRVQIKPGHSDETLAMISDHGEAMLQGKASCFLAGVGPVG